MATDCEFPAVHTLLTNLTKNNYFPFEEILVIADGFLVQIPIEELLQHKEGYVPCSPKKGSEITDIAKRYLFS